MKRIDELTKQVETLTRRIESMEHIVEMLIEGMKRQDEEIVKLKGESQIIRVN